MKNRETPMGLRCPVSYPLTEEECRALDRKFEHPEETVVCPRCGGELQYQSRNGSCAVKCATDGCLRDAIRGI